MGGEKKRSSGSTPAWNWSSFERFSSADTLVGSRRLRLVDLVDVAERHDDRYGPVLIGLFFPPLTSVAKMTMRRSHGETVQRTTG